MSKDKMSALRQREEQESLGLEDILRMGARELVCRAVECEIDVYLEEMSTRRLHDGRAEIVRNGRHRERSVLLDRKPTIDELERILDQEEDFPIEILPNGEVREKDGSTSSLNTMSKDKMAE